MKTLLTAAYIATMATPVIQEGAVVFDKNRIIAVGVAKTLRKQHPDAVVVELGDAVVLPGLVNAHTHLELTSLGQLPPPPSFVDWILDLRRRNMAVADPEAGVRASVAAGVAQCLKFGVTALGDNTLNPNISRPIVAAAGLRGVSFGEVLGMARRAGQMDFRLSLATDRSNEVQGFRAGIGPHAPYSLDLVGYRKCLEVAREHALPLATHLAETADEGEFLAKHTGAFRRLWEELGAWDQGVSRAQGGPIRAMRDIGLLEYPAVLAHVNYVDNEEMEILARGKASIVYCPRTHDYFGHPPHRYMEMLARGINVAVGTDSCASSPDLNLVDELRLLYRLREGIAPELLWSLVTPRAARGLGMEEMLGCIKPGLIADFCIFEVRTDDPLREILENRVVPSQVWMGGERRDVR